MVTIFNKPKKYRLYLSRIKSKVRRISITKAKLVKNSTIYCIHKLFKITGIAWLYTKIKSRARLKNKTSLAHPLPVARSPKKVTVRNQTATQSSSKLVIADPNTITKPHGQAFDEPSSPKKTLSVVTRSNKHHEVSMPFVTKLETEDIRLSQEPKAELSSSLSKDDSEKSIHVQSSTVQHQICSQGVSGESNIDNGLNLSPNCFTDRSMVRHDSDLHANPVGMYKGSDQINCIGSQPSSGTLCPIDSTTQVEGEQATSMHVAISLGQVPALSIDKAKGEAIKPRGKDASYSFDENIYYRDDVLLSENGSYKIDCNQSNSAHPASSQIVSIHCVDSSLLHLQTDNKPTVSLGLDLDLADTRSQPTTDTCFPLISPDSVIVTEEEQLIDHRQTKSRILLGETDTDNHGHSWILDNSMAPENDDGCSYVPYMDNRGQGREAFQRKIRQNLEQVLESRLNGTNYLDSIEYSHGPDFFLLEHNQYLGQDQNSFTERSKYRLVYFFLNELNRKCKDLEALMLSDRLQVRHEEAGSYEEYHPHGLAFSSRAEKPHLIHEESQVNHMDSFEQIITEVLTIDVEQWAKISDEPDQILWIINSVSEVTTNLLEDIKKQSLDDNEVAYKPWLLEDEDGASVVSSGLSTGKKLSDSIQKVNSPVQPTKNVDVLSDITIFYKNKQGDNKNRKKEMRTVSTTRSQSILQE